MEVSRNIPSTIQFLPPSGADFSERAKHVAWLLEEPLQASQELLARIYGFGSLHELQAAIAQGGEPGPYSSCVLDVQRSNRAIDFMLAIKCATREVASHKEKRYWRIRDIELFAEPQRHRQAWRQARAEIDGHEAALGAQPTGRPVSDYASIAAGEDSDYFRFTPLGQSVFDLTQLHSNDFFDIGGKRRSSSTCVAALQDIVRLHPTNPWALTSWLLCESERAWLGDWPRLHVVDADPGYATHARRNARLLLPKALEAVNLFKALISDQRPRLRQEWRAPADGDSRGWAMALYLAGRISLISEDFASSKRFLSANLKLCPHDEFGVGELMCVTSLVTGIRIPKPRNDAADLWHLMATAASAARSHDSEAAATHFARALSRSYAPLEPFAGTAACRGDVWLNTDRLGPSYVQEFMFLSERFWREHVEVRMAFEAMARRPGVAEAVDAFHREYQPTRETRFNSTRDYWIAYTSAKGPFARRLTGMLLGE